MRTRYKYTAEEVERLFKELRLQLDVAERLFDDEVVAKPYHFDIKGDDEADSMDDEMPTLDDDFVVGGPPEG